MEFRASQEADAQIAGLAVPPLQTLRWSFAASWLAPKPFVTAREFGLGAVLGAAFAFGIAGRPQRPLVQYVGLLLVCAAGIPGVRFLLTPLTFLAHPVLILYYALAMAPAAVVAALGFDRVLGMDEGDLAKSLRGPAGAVIGLAVVAVIARLTPLGWDTFGSAGEWEHWVVGLVQAGLILAAAVFVVRRWDGDRRAGALLLLLVLDLVLLGLRVHAAVPSQPLRLASRVPDASLSDGYLHVNELAVLLEDGLESAQTLSHAYTEEDVEYDDIAQGGEVEDILAEAPEIQSRLLDRRHPVHVGSGVGYRSTSGRTKLAPPRASAMLLPLARVLNDLPPHGRDDTDELDPWNSAAVTSAAKKALVADGLGARTQQLFGIPNAIDEAGTVWTTPNVLPRCWSPQRVEVEASQTRRVRRLLAEAVSTDVALIEAPATTGGAATVRCEDDVIVEASAPALVVLNERPHPGWRVDSDEGPLEAIPVNQIHQGVVVPAGTHRLTWTFRPPGLKASLLLAALGWIVGLGLARRTD